MDEILSCQQSPKYKTSIGFVKTRNGLCDKEEPSFNQHGTFNKKNYTDCKEWETQVYGQFVEIMDKVVGLIS